MNTLSIATYNIHKGFSHLNRRMVLHELRDRLRKLNADIVFLQETLGEHTLHAKRFQDYPNGAQHEFIAEEVWPHHAYGKNSVYEAGHHGNAILSRFPILQSMNLDVSAHRYESRGLLECEIELNNQQRVNCICVHFGLFARGRREQTRMLIDHVQRNIPSDHPIIIAGDFNDWRNQTSRALATELNVHDVFHLNQGFPARSFPARFPMLRLDRIYVRGFNVVNSDVHFGSEWRRLSDHAALSTRLRRHDLIEAHA